ncbi:hypothetical protein BABINDRAFT_162904 [Babjeviella inositovora NRRL Y-12698]|uniref:Uncharacterized protein n=1 Tax=Babjeviella inositovora NRRL Y-12698 TaxID=984486 RepID=A0A1E3QKL9_9ASCO|nr:uncharacterized protein BABINDRAFT_162904 [Babjeviella inositovora NRRL Y-12698]ODQ78246.1 hypothetical protein BABINDRAFT_162904 [Babjeviella inositovora NRRL Y-12698]
MTQKPLLFGAILSYAGLTAIGQIVQLLLLSSSTFFMHELADPVRGANDLWFDL